MATAGALHGGPLTRCDRANCRWLEVFWAWAVLPFPATACQSRPSVRESHGARPSARQDRTGLFLYEPQYTNNPSIGIGCYNTKRYEARSVGCHLRRAYRIRTSTADELRASRHVRRRQMHPWPLVRLPHGVVRRWVKISLLLGPRAPTGHCRQANHGSGAGTGADKREHGRGERKKKRDEPLPQKPGRAIPPLAVRAE